MTNRERWLALLAQEEASAPHNNQHIYDIRFLSICRGIAQKIKDDPSYEPPTVEEVMAQAPWGP